MNTEDAVAVIDEALAKLPRLLQARAFESEHTEFVQTTGLELGRIFGPDSQIVKNFQHVTYQHRGPVLFRFNYEDERAPLDIKAYLQGLEQAKGILLSARNQLATHGADALLAESRVKLHGGRVFVSHGSETSALTKVERYVRAMGLEPVIVVREPSEGLSVDDLVDKRMNQSDCALILATADEEVGGRRQPRPNVIHEIGLAQEKFGARVIYLKEEGCEFPSNVRPKVWGNFTQDNMEEAFKKIILELRAFGLA